MMRLQNAVRYLVGELFGYALIYSGVAKWFLKRRVARGEVTAFFLHDPERDVFEKVIRRARQWGIEFIDDDQLLAFMQRRVPADRPLVHLSVDDGWRRNMDNVAGFAELHQIPITYFIATEALETGTFWWDRVPDRATAVHLIRRSTTSCGPHMNS